MRRQLLEVPNVERLPFKDFLKLAAFIASIGLSLSLAASQTLANTTTFMGRTDSAMMASVQSAAIDFTWGAAIFGFALALSFSAQLLLTSPRVQALLQPEPVGRLWMRVIVGGMSWLSLLLVTAGLLIVGRGLNPVDDRAGATLQWAIGVMTLSLSGLWVSLLINYYY